MRHLFLYMPFVVVLLLPACNSGNREPSEILSGKVTLNSQVLTMGTVMVIGPDRTEASAQIHSDGSYRIENPPKGELKFKAFILPPPPPGVPPMPPVKGQPVVPAKYIEYKNELAFDYTGGKQTYDVVMNP
jgi:hypothetical protein